MQPRSLTDLADVDGLKSSWKTIRQAGGSLRLQQFSLAHDPLEMLAYDWNLSDNLQSLSDRVLNRQYQPSGPTTIRAAKGTGLTRPVSFLTIDDCIIYVSLVRLTENQLLQSSYSWARFGRTHKPKKKSKDDPPLPPEYSWFVQWLKRDGQVWDIVQNCDWVIETDISNFFGNMNLDSVVAYVRTHGRLDDTLANLLRLKLGEYAPLNNYRSLRSRSLPQETFDVSRILAHTFLRQLDAEFEHEGNAKRYSRWVDDVVMGADSWPEALQLVRRFQEALERLDLYPNGAKTSITRSSRFAVNYDQRQNDYIGRVEDQIETHGRPINQPQFRSRVQRHARTRQDRLPSWDRVLRRYYTVSKRIGEDSLLNWWDRHIEDAPKSAAHFFDYLSTFQLTTARLARLQRLLDRLGGVYTDVEILAREYVLTAPNLNSSGLRDELAAWGLGTVTEHRLDRPHLAAAAAIVVAKFGTSAQVSQLAPLLDHLRTADNVCRQQLAAILLSSSDIDRDYISQLLYFSGRESSQHFRFLLAMDAADESAINRTRAAAQPVHKSSPERYVFKPRLLVLAPLLRRRDPKWSIASSAWTRALRRNGRSFHDAAALRLLA